MMHKPLVTIIVPFFNPNDFFIECLESLESQDYERTEVVLVNDGSSEEFVRIAETFTEKNEGWVLVSQENKGVASARQAGLLASTGDLIIHADSDDVVPQGALSTLVDKQIETSADIVLGSYLVRHKRTDSVVAAPVSITHQMFLKGLLLGEFHGSLCNKLLRRSLYEGLSFNCNMNYMEDKLMLARILQKSSYKISCVSEVVYIYRQHGESTTACLGLESIESARKIDDLLRELYFHALDSDTLRKMALQSRLFQISQCARNGVNVFDKSDEALLSNKEIPVKRRFVVWLVKYRLTACVKWYYQFKKIIM
ncbi:glycosyltransferase family 2 protein [Pseudomonas profundi]|uniref:glycosyltransferase family 2 protein n=1 Tax=Pseudomonas profundi TaxID=1981513 RepID=UPI00123B33F2|nr:glycosyltransferase family 2 protein [Pseudomonas profundi]